jgi:NAD(P)-dependent dehydrogenase (short-subunit alcohol dehydrogenase family)
MNLSKRQGFDSDRRCPRLRERAIAIGLAQRGSDIAVCNLNLETARSVAQKIRSMGREILPLKVDDSKAPEVKARVESTLGEFWYNFSWVEGLIFRFSLGWAWKC